MCPRSLWFGLELFVGNSAVPWFRGSVVLRFCGSAVLGSVVLRFRGSAVLPTAESTSVAVRHAE